MRYYIKLLLVVLLMISTTSCHRKTECKQKRVCLNLNYADGEVPTLHPFILQSYSYGRSLGKLLNEGLTRIDAQGNPILAGAISMEMSPDGMKYTFRIRNQWWSDGTSVTADDYVNTWRYAVHSKADCPSAYLFYAIKNGQEIKQGSLSPEYLGVSAPDDHTLVVELAAPSPYFLHLVAHPIFAPLREPGVEPVVFNGPFTCKNWKKGIDLELEPNPYFWDKAHISLKNIHISFVQNEMTVASMFEKGELDWAGDPLGALPREEALHLLDKGTALSKDVDRLFLLYFNTSHPWLKSAKIRQALAMTIDRKQITDHIIFGIPTASITQAKADLMMEEKEAKQLFVEGLRELGLQKKDIKPLVFKCVNLHRTMVEFIQSRWMRLFGIPLQIEAYDWVTYRQMLFQRDFAIGGCLESILYKDPLELLARFENGSDASNFCGWKNTEFKEKICLCRSEADVDKREERLIETELVRLKEIPFTPLFRFKHVYAHHPKLKGYVFDGAGCVDFAYASLE